MPFRFKKNAGVSRSRFLHFTKACAKIYFRKALRNNILTVVQKVTSVNEKLILNEKKNECKYLSTIFTVK